MKTLGQFIRETRDEKDYSLREFAKKIGCSPAFLSDVELGRRYPSDVLFSKIASNFNISISELKKYDTRPPTNNFRNLSHVDPNYAFAFRTVLENKVSANQLIDLANRTKNRELKSKKNRKS